MPPTTGSVTIDSEFAGGIARRALLRAVGYTDQDVARPMIAVIHSWSEMSVGEAHFRQVADEVRRGIREAGGTPAEIIIPGMCGELKANQFVRRYFFAYRDFAAALVEIFVNFHGFDGAVLMATCDNQVPAFLMGAARTNVPSIFVTGGYAAPGSYQGRTVTAFDVLKGVGEFAAGKLSHDALEEMVCCACTTPGACPEMGTANTMCAVTEALGMSLPGTGAVPAIGPRLLDIGREAGKRILDLVGQGLRPSTIMTRESLENAIRVVLAIGGSPNAVIHLAAIGAELGIEVRLDDWDRLSRETPFICGISPNVRGVTMQDLDRAGGITGVMKNLSPLLQQDVLTVTGNPLRNTLESTPSPAPDVIRPLDNPIRPEGGIAVLCGNLAPEGAMVKQSAVPVNLLKHTGPARVFDSEEEAVAALGRGEIHAGDFVVVRYEGPRGCPGSREVVNLMHCLVGMGLVGSVGAVTDGRVSGTNLGLAVIGVSPEAAAGGPIALVREGDLISVDLPGRTLSLHVSECELTRRREMWRPPTPRVERGVLAAYARLADSFARGARIF